MLKKLNLDKYSNFYTNPTSMPTAHPMNSAISRGLTTKPTTYNAVNINMVVSNSNSAIIGSRGELSK
jgi:hypothetical protein